MTTDRPNDGFDYGERKRDGQFERHPTTDEGEFVQPVRESYVHDKCGGVTTMGTKLAESFARDPDQYGKTFCADCQDYHPLDEFVWHDTDERLDGSTAEAEGDPHDWMDVRKKPVEVEARGPYYDPTVVETLEGDFEVDEEYAEGGFYIVRGVEGEVYPCQYDIFHDTYDLL